MRGHSLSTMADDHAYLHQVEVDDFEEDDSASSSDMDPSEPAQELMVEIDPRGGQYSSSPDSPPQRSKAPKAHKSKQPGSHQVQSAPSARRPKNLEVEVAGPTEDVRSGLPSSSLLELI